MPYFLTQIKLTPELIVRQKITDSYSIHRLVYDQFSRNNNDNSIKRSMPLWALSSVDIVNKVVILSSNPPRDDVVPYIQNNRNVIIYPEKIFLGKNFIFKITANPILKSNGKILPIRDCEDVKLWFTRQCDKNGFVAKNLIITNIRADIFKDKFCHLVTINKAEISGELTVNDPVKFKFAVLNGIGREKAFGCGLLQIIPKK